MFSLLKIDCIKNDFKKNDRNGRKLREKVAIKWERAFFLYFLQQNENSTQKLGQLNWFFVDSIREKEKAKPHTVRYRRLCVQFTWRQTFSWKWLNFAHCYEFAFFRWIVSFQFRKCLFHTCKHANIQRQILLNFRTSDEKHRFHFKM